MDIPILKSFRRSDLKVRARATNLIVSLMGAVIVALINA